MPRAAHRDRTSRDPRSGSSSGGGGRLFRLVRFSHIFASVVREVLELKLLQEVSPLPLSLPQLHLLKLMSLNGGHQVGQVADFLGVSPPAITKNIDKLERHGLVVRTPSKGDRRATLLSASKRGRRLVEKYEALKAERLSPVLDRFRSEEISQLSQLLERFSIALLEIEPCALEVCLRCDAYVEQDCPVGRLRGGCPFEKVRGAHPIRGGGEA